MKTYKREIATFSLVVLYGFYGYTIYILAVAGMHEALIQFVSVLVMPTFVTVAAAFGIDAYFKGKMSLEELSKDKKEDKTQ